MRTETELNISVIPYCCDQDDCVLTYKFLRGVLLKMHDKSADGVFHLAILALLKTRQTLIVFH